MFQDSLRCYYLTKHHITKPCYMTFLQHSMHFIRIPIACSLFNIIIYQIVSADRKHFRFKASARNPIYRKVIFRVPIVYNKCKVTTIIMTQLFTHKHATLTLGWKWTYYIYNKSTDCKPQSASKKNLFLNKKRNRWFLKMVFRGFCSYHFALGQAKCAEHLFTRKNLRKYQTSNEYRNDFKFCQKCKINSLKNLIYFSILKVILM